VKRAIGIIILLAAVPAGADDLLRTGPIEVFGNDHIRTSTILREIPLKTGDPFSYSAVEAGRRNLHYIAGIDYSEIKVRYHPPDSSFGLSVFVTEKSTITGSVWLQRGYENKFSLGMRSAEESLFGTGQRLEIAALVFNSTRLSVDWQNPWIAGDRVGAGARAEYRSYVYVYDDFDDAYQGAEITATGFALSVSRGVGPRTRLYFEAGYQWTTSDREGVTVDPDGDRFPQFELGAERDRRWTANYPFTGTYLLALVRTAGPFDDLYGIVEGVVDARAFHALADEIVLAGHCVAVVRNGNNIPAYRRQHTGGGWTLRGWDYGSFNANSSMVAGAELRAPVNFARDRPLEDVLIGVELHAFADAGVVWDDASQFAADRFEGGGGVGLAILNRQVRGLRLDYGWRRNSSGILHVEVGLMF
jgi:outer membrane protein assembly factor BamA